MDVIEVKLPFYSDFSPFEIDSIPDGFDLETLPSFNSSVERYFTALAQHASKTADLSKDKSAMEAAAWRKYENMKQDQENRLGKIRVEKEDFFYRARLIEMNADEVSAICNIVNTMISSGMSAIVHSVIKEGKKNGDELAGMIQKINLEKNKVSVILADKDNMEEKAVEVDIDLKMSPFENAKEYYGRMKKANLKEKKTVEASEQALKIAKSNAIKEVKKQEKKFSVVKLPPRKQYWFEKFHWFLSSENYLVLSGRDAAQNEALVKKHLRKGDLYVHVEIQGGSSTVVKNPSGAPVPSATIDEIATATICRSKAWDYKVVVGAWWVYDHQVSKTAPSGEYIGTGSFMIRGKKNFIHINRLEMGFGLLFKVDESSIARHADERKPRVEALEESIINPEDTGEGPIKEEEIGGALSESDLSRSQVSISETGAAPKEKEEVTVLTLNRRPFPVPQHMAKNNEPKGKKEQKPKEEKGQKTKAQLNLKNEGKSKQKGKGAEQNQNEGKQKKISKEKMKKIKKMQEKYGEQDEEDRELLMRLRGAQAMKIPEQFDLLANKNNAKFSKKAEKEEKPEEDSEKEDNEENEKEQEDSGSAEEEEKKEEVNEKSEGDSEKEEEKLKEEEEPEKKGETVSQDPENHLPMVPGISRTYSAVEGQQKEEEGRDSDDEETVPEIQELENDEEASQVAENFNDLTGCPTPDGKPIQTHFLKTQFIFRNRCDSKLHSSLCSLLDRPVVQVQNQTDSRDSQKGKRYSNASGGALICLIIVEQLLERP